MSAVNLSNTNGLDSIIIQQGYKRARASITINEWHHVMLVHDGLLDEIYVDCVKLNTAQISVDKSINGLSTTVLGSNRNKMGFNFSGKIDDIRIYNQALNAQELKTLCDEQNSCSVNFSMLHSNIKTKGGSSATFNTSSTENNAQFQWQVNDGNGFTAINNQCFYTQNSSNVLQIPVTPLAWNNNKYRCIISNEFCSDTTNESVLSVDSTVLIYDTVHVVIPDTTHITVNDTISRNCDTLTFYFKLGINLLDIVSLQIYPNPTNDLIYLTQTSGYDLSSTTVEIRNSLSQLMFITNFNTNTLAIDVSKWTGDGLYFVNILDVNKNTIITRKIVVQQ